MGDGTLAYGRLSFTRTVRESIMLGYYTAAIVVTMLFYMVCGNTISRAAGWLQGISGVQIVVTSLFAGPYAIFAAVLGLELIVSAMVLWLTGHRRYARKYGYWKSDTARRWWNRFFGRRRGADRLSAEPNPYAWPPEQRWDTSLPGSHTVDQQCGPEDRPADPCAPHAAPARVVIVGAGTDPQASAQYPVWHHPRPRQPHHGWADPSAPTTDDPDPGQSRRPW